jgi:hypothetical protein
VKRFGIYDGFVRTDPMARISCLLSIFARRLPSVDGNITALTSDERPTDMIKSTLHCRNTALPKIEISLLNI